MTTIVVAVFMGLLLFGPFFMSPRTINKKRFELHRGKPRGR